MSAEVQTQAALAVHELGLEMVRLDEDIVAATRSRDWAYVGELRVRRLAVQLHRSELLRDVNSWRLTRRPG